MAAASVQLSPHATALAAGMATVNRRTPLTALPNVGNSPFRGPTAAKDGNTNALITARSGTANALKRPRPTGSADQEASRDNQPPAKKHIVNTNAPTTPRKTHPGPGNSTPTAKRKHAARVREPRAVAAAASHKSETESIAQLRDWRERTARAFPNYVFYFEGISDGFARDLGRDLRKLGSQYTQFFSREVTHLVTLHPVPAEDKTGSNGKDETEEMKQTDQEKPRIKAINPSVLDRSAPLKSKLIEAKKPLAPSNDAGNRRTPASELAQKARQMGIKIWSLEKFNRVLDVLFDDEMKDEILRIQQKTRAPTKAHTNPQDLQTLIRNEEVHGPNDQELKLLHDVIPFKGPYVYVRCVNEKVKPIMVRQWTAVPNKDDGDWPQFRSVTPGKCPFLPEEEMRKGEEAMKKHAEKKAQLDAEYLRKEKEKEQHRRNMNAQLCDQIAKSKTTTATENTASSRPALSKQSTAESLPKRAVRDQDFKAPFPQRATAPTHQAICAAEPMASGLQASNVTSAIRSQMISSTAAAPGGVKAGTSREIFGLQRKVLERGSSFQQPQQQQQQQSTSTQSQGLTELSDAAAREQARAKLKAYNQRKVEQLTNPDRLAKLDEERRADDDEQVTSRPSTATEKKVQKVVKKKKEAKPGYCENCREKFEDFDEHALSKTHRKFAMSRENWKDLDGLLSLLERPVRIDF